MCDYPSAYEERIVTGRKPHRCCECRRVMPVGERQEIASGIWDGTPARFRTCLSCAAIRSWLAAEIRAGRLYGDEDCGVPFGDLEAVCFEALHEWNAENPSRAIGWDPDEEQAA